ncbi:IQ calmodulin-binding motif protein [Myriangium duriaei CBS 260.36]|uniref:IQ calmodulin-binding motif protein n=1 Tax=Myriangium duriaei CBS 260.36 TaxID=1168546 RepID=A0A9P4J6D1_9PEZI|nr:IQ calmodulin-binding motif protein [Myriangium duriaei CBS 260.36]
MRPRLTTRTVALCQSQDTVSSELAKDPSIAPQQIANKIFGERETTGKPTSLADDTLETASEEDLQQALSCGRWGPTKPGELFARAFHDVLCCLEADPLSGVVSPSLIGSYGTMPLSIIAPLVDLVRHMANVIVRARKEVLFATCSWSPSDAVDLVSDALRELSRRAGERGERIVVKIIYDKASLKQVFHNHQKLDPDFYSGEKVKLPHPNDIPNIDMEVSSLHVPPLGTLHSKFMVVDRKIAIVESNNMEDNPNMEMSTHLEGPIVDSLYDSFLITWAEKMTPPLPTHNTPAHVGGFGALHSEPVAPTTGIDKPQYPTETDPRSQQQIANEGTTFNRNLTPLSPGNPHYDDDIPGEISRMQAMYSSQHGESRVQAINNHLNKTSKSDAKPSISDIQSGDEFTPYIAHANDLVPMALVSRRPHGPMSNSDAFVPQNEAFLSLIRNAKSSIFIQTPDLNATHLLAAITAAVKRGIEVTYYVCLGYNDPGEMMPGQGGTNETFCAKLYKDLTLQERSRLNVHWYTGKDQSKPIAHSFKQRTCHVKILIADGHVGIQGSGNQDTQSWYHSQEVNVMIDSEAICSKWREGIERNQNTFHYGKGSQEDGVWRDEKGHQVEGATPKSAPPISWVKGAIGMGKKLKDKGGF